MSQGQSVQIVDTFGTPGQNLFQFATSVAGDTIQCANNIALTAGSIRVSFGYGFSNNPIGNG